MKTVPCPHCGQLIAPAQLLGQSAAGRAKRYTPEELARRRARLPSRLGQKRQPNCAACHDKGWTAVLTNAGKYERVPCDYCSKGKELRETRAINELNALRPKPPI